MREEYPLYLKGVALKKKLGFNYENKGVGTG
jgi:hypothetical protein